MKYATRLHLNAYCCFNVSYRSTAAYTYWFICCGGDGSFDVQKAMTIFSEARTQPGR